MQPLDRNDKQQQRQRLAAETVAQEKIAELNKLLNHGGHPHMRVGELVSLAAVMGLLDPEAAGRR